MTDKKNRENLIGIAGHFSPILPDTRITSVEHSAKTINWPALSEISLDYGLVDIEAERFDAGVRLGEQVAKDMIAVCMAPAMQMAVVGSPAYFAKRPPPVIPQDLVHHRCINLRLPTSGGLYVWVFEKKGSVVRVRTQGPLVLPHP